MEAQEAFKILAKFEGWEMVSTHWVNHNSVAMAVPDYLNDLNALVPVWERLEINTIQHFLSTPKGYQWETDLFGKNAHERNGHRKTLQEAAAIATAKAILALTEGE